jgi:hypothetical protein
MNDTPTVSIPVDRLVEIQNTSGDTLCLTPSGAQGWHVQVLRGGQRHRRGDIQILEGELPDLASLKTAADSFLVGDYRNFHESERRRHGGTSVFLNIVGTVIMAAVALTFLAFMIALFLDRP